MKAGAWQFWCDGITQQMGVNTKGQVFADAYCPSSAAFADLSQFTSAEICL